MNRMIMLAAAATFAVATEAAAHGAHAGMHWFGGLDAFGQPGSEADATRVLRVTLGHSHCTIPGDVSTHQGDTIAFAVENAGSRTGELVLGNIGAVAEHARLAERDPELDHELHAMVHLEPGDRGTLVWRFTRVGIFEYGCFVPGPQARSSAARIQVLR